MSSGLSDVKKELLARLLKGAGAAPATTAVSVIPAVAADRRVRLSFAQERVWLTCQLAGDVPVFNLVAAGRLRVALDETMVLERLAALVRRHDSMRTSVEVVDGLPTIEVHDTVPVELPVTDLTGVPEGAQREAAATELIERIGLRPYRLDQAPLWRLELLRLGPADNILVFGAHHLINDAASLMLVLSELAMGPGEDRPPTAYRDFAAWQRDRFAAGDHDGQLEFWRDRLASPPPPLALPTDRPRRAEADYAGATLRFTAPPELAERLRNLGRDEGTSPYTVMLSTFMTLLARYTGQHDLVVGSQVAGRQPPELQRVIGMFVNMVPVRASLAGDVSFREVLLRVREATTAAFANQDVPFEKLVRELRGDAADRSHAPLVQVSCNMPLQGAPPAGSEEVPMPIAPGGSLLDLTLHVIPRGRAFELQFEYPTALFDEATIDRMARGYLRLLDAVSADPDAPLSGLDLLDAGQRAELTRLGTGPASPLATGGAGATDAHTALDAGMTLPDLIARQVTARPDSVAVRSGGRTLTYAQLRTRADRVAGQLIAAGVRRGAVVGVCVPRGLDLVAVLTGVWRAGGAFLPLDPEQPPARWRQLLAMAGATAVVTESARLDAMGEAVPAGCAVVDLDADAATSGLANAPHVARHPDDAAYVMFTSGSTGRPKGVVITHGGIANRVCWSVDEQGITAADRVLAKTRFGFDAAVLEWFAPLIAGATIVVAPPGVERDPAALVRCVGDAGATVLQLVPSVLRAMLDEPGWSKLGSLRQVWLAGEPLDHALVRRLREKVPVQVWNTYGPTECSIDVTAYPVPLDATEQRGPVPIGRPLHGIRVAVLDPHGRLAPVGLPGELCVGGVGVARGYLHEPVLTAERFVPDPTGPAGERLYRTGDLVRWGASGELEFIGRVDDQVKINGVRIEPAEVQAALAEHPNVRQVFVTSRTTEHGRSLVAYLVTDGRVETERLRRFLGTQLPEAMIPAVFVPLDTLPRDANGKVDRAALPSPESASAGPDHRPPSTPAEQLVAGVWAELLDRDEPIDGPIDVRDDFFALGGHSLMLGRLALRLQERSGVPVTIRDLFSGLTVTAQATLIDTGLFDTVSADDAVPPVTAIDRAGRLPLSFGQRRLWFLDQLNPNSAEYLTPLFLRLPGPVDPERVRSAIEALVARHEVLRTRYEVDGLDDPEPWQVIDPPGRAELRVLDCGSADLTDVLADEFTTGFDLRTGPVWRAVLARLEDENDAILAIIVHHIASDGWSSAILDAEFRELYADPDADPAAVLPEPTVQYADFAAWQRDWLSDDLIERQLGHWRDHLTGAPMLELPTDRPRPAVRDPRGGIVAFRVPAELADAVLTAGRHRGATPFMTLLAVYAALLSRHSGQHDFTIGTPVAGRVRPELAGMVGVFINTLVLRCDLGNDPEFGELLHRVRAASIGAFANQDLPFERVVDELQSERDLSRTPLYGALFDLHEREHTGYIPGEELSSTTAPVTTRQDLGLVVRRESDGSLLGMFDYAAALFDRSTIERMAGHYVRLLESVAADSDVRLSHLELLTPGERDQLVVRWNDTATERPAGLFLDAFAASVAATPDAIAVSAAATDERVTYADLDARANRLAHRLIELGAGPDRVVGICLDRGVELIVAMLGVLRAGAAYVPLDPEHPRERWRWALADTAAGIVVTQQRHAAAIAELAPIPQVLLTRGPNPALAGHPATPPDVRIDPDSLAYVMYTSGSTGRPKGVLISHEGLVHYLWWTVEGYAAFGDGGAPLFSSVAFDMVVPNIYTPLMTGQPVHLLPQEYRVADLGALLVERGPFSFIKLTPGHAELLAGQLDEKEASGLAAMLAIGADALPGRVADRIRRLAGDTRLLNEYGPTEITVANSTFPITGPSDREIVPIGRPIPNTTMYVLDAVAQPVPVGVVGELCIGGITVARGYNNLPDRTADRFVPDPFCASAEPGRRMYRTGDLARVLPDGNVEFLGRADDQIKIRGYRIEPGEVQTVLAEHPTVHEALVLAHEVSPGDKRLVAYCVPVAGTDLAHEDELAKHCREQLPEQMVPLLYVGMERIPLNENGKVNRRALPAPDAPNAGDQELVAPRTPTEERVAEVWASLLGVAEDTIGVHHNFFRLGGHSILAVRLNSRLQEEFDVALPLRVIFEKPTVAQLADAVEEEIRAEIAAMTDDELAEMSGSAP